MADNYVNKDNLKQTLEKLKGEIDKKGGTPHFKGTTAEVLAHYGVSSIDDIPEGNITTVTDIEPELYILPIASATELGGIKVGNNLSIDENGVLNATGGSGAASDISYNNTDSGLEASNVQDAIDELSGKAITTDNISQQSVAHATSADTATDNTKLPLAGGSISGDIKPDETGKYYIGTADNAFSGVYAKTIASRLNGGTYGSINVATEGTETTTGACRLTVGNSAASGTDKNAYGEIRLYGTGTYYSGLRTNANLAANRIFYLPATDATKTLAIDDEATTTDKGLMSAADKTKLDGIAEEANKTTIVNNLTTTTGGNALDARQGRALANGSARDNTKLPLTGGKVTGDTMFEKPLKLLRSDATSASKGGILFTSPQGDAGTIRNSHQSLKLSASAEDYNVTFGVADNGSPSNRVWTFYPNVTDICLGTASSKWGQIYSTKSTISTSDRKEKKNISIIDKAKDFIMRLKPVSYMFSNATSDRHHYGFIAQDVEEAMNELDMTSLDFGGLCKDLKEGSDDEYIYGLRYEEFIAPLVATVQQQQKEIDELKAEIEALKQNNINAM